MSILRLDNMSCIQKHKPWKGQNEKGNRKFPNTRRKIKLSHKLQKQFNLPTQSSGRFAVVHLDQNLLHCNITTKALAGLWEGQLEGGN